MLHIAACVLLGAYAVQFLPVLPMLAVFILLAILGVMGCAFNVCRRIACLAIGVAVVGIAASEDLANRWSNHDARKNIIIIVQIIDFPINNRGNIRFLASTSPDSGLPPRLMLSMHKPSYIPQLGETWRLKVRLRAPRSYANPGGFDYAKWLHRARIGATGYVLESSDAAVQLNGKVARVAAYRRAASERIDRLFEASPARAILKALTVSARSDLSAAQWSDFAATGTSHLMAISGLHIGLAASAAFLLGWVVAATLCSRANYYDLAAMLAAITAFAYAQLAGMGIPARRALIMLLLVTLAIRWRRRIDSGHLIGLVCVLVCLADPLSIYAPGFILSFTAVGLLLWHGRQVQAGSASFGSEVGRRLANGAIRLSAVQWLLLFGMLPFTVALFGRVALLAPIANIVVLPVFSILTIPAALLGILLAGPLSVCGDFLLVVALQSIRGILFVVEQLARVAPAEGLALGGLTVPLVAGAAMIMALLPAGWPGRYLAVISMVATLIYRPPAVPASCIDATFLDVGQGLAVVIETRDHALLYDTGPAYRSGSDAAERVVGPFLNRRGIRKLERLVISHADLDHAGGLRWLRENIEIGEVLSGEADELSAISCEAGQEWSWNQANFRILHPAVPTSWSGNDASCVLQIELGEHRILLLGDIESPAESVLVAGGLLGRISLVSVPHHGSRTSSTAALVSAVTANVAVVSAGYGNRWGFPKDDVVARWMDSGARVLTTAQSGAIQRRYCMARAPEPLLEERLREKRYWR